MEFEWDKNKAASNLSKHGVSFDEARTVLMIPFILIFMIQTIPMMNTGILSSDNQHKTAY